jgi:uncharacterized Zn-binding protein involved in type VI secretion
MGVPAAVLGDQVSANCPGHLIPNPATGAPQPSPPIPFTAPLSQGLSTSVLICGKPAAVAGSAGSNVPPHVGLHPSDPFFPPAAQTATVSGGSASVLIGGAPAARSGAPATVCGGLPGQLTGSAVSVLIGG